MSPAPVRVLAKRIERRTTAYEIVVVAVLPSRSVALTVNVFGPTVEVLIAAPFATVPVQAAGSTPAPASRHA